MTLIRAAMAEGIATLRAVGIDGPELDARHLMGAALGIGADRVLLALNDPMPPAARVSFDAMIARRAERHPVSHILGYRDFYGRRFQVTADVLDPRPETEELVALALQAPAETVLDLGIGSGAILLSILADQPEARGVGTDISEPALAVAKQNAEALDVTDRVRFQQSDWWQGVEESFDLITSNPPYISTAAYEGLAPELHHEPRIALTPGGDGLAAYRQIAAGAPDHLTQGGRLLVEIGFDQGDAVAALFREAGLDAVAVHPDLNGKDRVVAGVKPR